MFVSVVYVPATCAYDACACDVCFRCICLRCVPASMHVSAMCAFEVGKFEFFNIVIAFIIVQPVLKTQSAGGVDLYRNSICLVFASDRYSLFSRAVSLIMGGIIRVEGETK